MTTNKETVGRSILASLISTLGPVSFGYCLAYSSSALVDLSNDQTDPAIRLSDSQGSWFSSLVTVGAMIGSCIGGWLIDKFGRKGSILMSAVPFELGWLLISFAKNHAMLYAGRIITGLACGVVSLAVPVYIAEIAPARLRGALGASNQLAITFGLLLSFVLGVVCHWKWLALIGAILPVLLVILMFNMPETPRWSLGKNRRTETLNALLWLRGPEVDIVEELTAIESSPEQQEKPSLREWLSPELAKPLILSIGLMFFQQFTGMNAVIFNAASIFSAAGFKNGKLVGITIGLFQFLGTCLACLIIERTGRRILLLISSITLAVSQFGLGLYFEIYIPPHDESQSSDALSSIIHSVEASKISWLSVFCLIFFNLGHALAWGPIPWLVMSEMFPLRARGPAGSISVLSNWLAAFIVTLTFNSLQSSLTVPGAYWFYAGWLLLGFVFVYLLMPETKGKTLEEIEALFDKNKRSYQPIE